MIVQGYYLCPTGHSSIGDPVTHAFSHIYNSVIVNNIQNSCDILSGLVYIVIFCVIDFIHNDLKFMIHKSA